MIIGPDWKSLLMTTLLIVAPSGAFLGLVAPDLGQRLSWVIVGFSCAIVLFTFSMLAMTALRDPGFIPRKPYDEAANLNRAMTRDYHINGYTVTVKWCTSCNHYRPPRCSHCAVCDNCVEKFDHHCPWVGTCIGRRNYRYFLLFIFSTTLLDLWVFGWSWASIILYLQDNDSSFGQALRNRIACIVLISYTFLMVWFIGGLSGFHVYLSSCNQTTYEHFRHRFSGQGNPYNVGCAKNCGEVFCKPIPARGQCGRADTAAGGANGTASVYMVDTGLAQRDLELGEVSIEDRSPSYVGTGIGLPTRAPAHLGSMGVAGDGNGHSDMVVVVPSSPGRVLRSPREDVAMEDEASDLSPGFNSTRSNSAAFQGKPGSDVALDSARSDVAAPTPPKVPLLSGVSDMVISSFDEAPHAPRELNTVLESEAQAVSQPSSATESPVSAREMRRVGSELSEGYLSANAETTVDRTHSAAEDDDQVTDDSTEEPPSPPSQQQPQQEDAEEVLAGRA